MIKRYIKPVILTLFALIIVFAMVVARSQHMNPKETVVLGQGLWLDLSFEEYVDVADRIVYGKVIGFEDVIVIEEKINEVANSTQVYTPVNIEVVEWIKGDNPSETLTFYQTGGETDTRIYIDADVVPLSKDEYVLLFINERGGRVMPCSALKTENGNITVPADMLPSQNTKSTNILLNNSNNSIAVSDYIKIIESIMIKDSTIVTPDIVIPEDHQETRPGEESPTDVNEVELPVESLIKADGQTIAERFDVPQGFIRLESESESFAYYLQNLPLKPDGTKVKYYDGREKPRDVYLAVVDFSLGERDLQQCADAVMRLRAEYLYAKNRYDEIHFNFVNGFNAEFSKWADGNGISVNGNTVSWISNNNDSSYESFQKYLDIVYAYASTLSLEKELIVKPFSDLTVGDVFIQGGSPGHCVIIVDMAVNESTGEKIFMLAQSYMPAQDIQILKGNTENSPWFSANIEDTLKTPEWTFKVSDLKTW